MDAAIDVTQTNAAAEVKRLTGLGADIVVDAVGNQMDQAIHLARRGGQVILFGLRPHDNPPVNQYTVTRYDLTVHGTFVGLHPFAQTIQLLESRRVQPSVLVTHRLPLGELMQGIQLMRTQAAMKVLIEVDSGPSIVILESARVGVLDRGTPELPGVADQTSRLPNH